MTLWTKEEALSELNKLIEEIEELKNKEAFLKEHTNWWARTLTFLEEVFGPYSRYYLTFASFTWKETGSFIIGPKDLSGFMNPQKAIEEKDHIAYIRQLDSAEGILEAALDHLKRADDIATIYEGKDTAQESSAIIRIINIAERKLRKVIRQKPSTEKEIQEAFENLLIGTDILYSREKESIEYSSKTYIPDFTIDKIDLVIEIKFCVKEDREKKIIAEINDDILAYQTEYSNLFFIVYDLGFIRDVDRFIDSFQKHQNVIVKVIKH